MSIDGYKSRAIVLHTMPHGESGHIVYMFTEAFGRVSYYVNSGKRGVPTVGGSKIMLYPLSIIEIVGSKGGGAFHRIKEAKRMTLNMSAFNDIYKSTISLFLSEFLYKVIKDEHHNPMLFDYILHSLLLFDAMEEGKSNFHIYFLVHLTKYLGFYPNNGYSDDSYLDMRIGDFVIIRPTHQMVMDRDESRLLWRFMSINSGEIATIESSGKVRSRLLDNLVNYIGLHNDTKYTIKSLEYLREIF